MRKSVLILMIDVLVLSVLTITVDKTGQEGTGLVVPAHRWSSVIKEGLAKEQEMLGRISSLQEEIRKAETRAEQAARLAELAMENQQAEREDYGEAKDKIDALSLRLKNALGRIQTAEEERRLAEQKAAQAAKAEADALAREQAALEEREQAAQQVREAEQKRLTALEQEKQALLKAEAATEAASAAERLVIEAREREIAAKEAADASRNLAKDFELSSAASSVKAEMAREAATEARKREAEARRRIELSLAREGAAMERARQAETQKERAIDEIRASQERIIALRENLTALSLKEQFAESQLKAAEDEISKFEQKMLELEEDKNASIWVKRDQALRLLQVLIVEDQRESENRKRVSLYAPVVRIGTFTGILSEFDSLGFGLNWWVDKINRNVSTLVFSISPMSVEADNASPALLKDLIMVPHREPRVCYISVPDTSSEGALEPVGMARLKQERIQEALLFKKNAPNDQSPVSITPIVGTDYLVVRKTDAATRVRIDTGDYLTTERGEFVGVMVSRTHAYVVPATVPDPSDRENIPLTKEPGTPYYESFVQGVNAVRQAIKDAGAFPARTH